MFFYDSTLQLYISDKPLLISDRVLKAGERIGISVTWDDNGYVNKVSYKMAKGLSQELGSVLLTVQDFMGLAQRQPWAASQEFAEWLDDTYTLSQESTAMLDAKGNPISVPQARPAWFSLDNIDGRGLPTLLSEFPERDLWKFWTLGHRGFTAAAVRSFVVSSGTCSLDLGIPQFARHSKLMVRECYRTKPATTQTSIDRLWPDYLSKTLSRDDEAIRSFLVSIDPEEIVSHCLQDKFITERDQERLADLMGKKRLLLGDYQGLRPMTCETICKAISAPKASDMTYVTGHQNPDADSIVSSVFEATRRSLVYPEKPCVAWVERLPPVVETILGSDISARIRNTPKFEPHHDVVLVDCHRFDHGHQYQVRSIIDHHIITTKFPYYVSISQEVSWSSTIQVYIKMLGSGLDVDQQTARILLEATEIEAEPHLMQSMSRIDQMALERLKSLSHGSASYQDLMQLLLHSNVEVDPFLEDYKESCYGFAVLKSQRLTSYDERAMKNNVEKHLPLTVVKQVIFDGTMFDRLSTEKISMHFNDRFYDKGFRNAVKHVILSACAAFHGADNVTEDGFSVLVTNVPCQTPRLLLMPALEGIVKEHLRFFYSTTIGRFVSCGFYTDITAVYGRPGEETLPTTCMSFDHVKGLLSKQENTSFLSLKQFWYVYHERQGLGDTVSLDSMRNSQYVELLDTVIREGKAVSHGEEPTITLRIEDAKPALIRSRDIDRATGFPSQLISPDTYGDPELWRYWSPDRDENVATRGHIFVMDQTSIDLKIGRNERTKQLTFRPIYRDICDLKYEIRPDGGRWISVTVFPRLFSVPGSG
ncbi:DHH phosphoesterase [Fusarium tjaetaba]|uniref:DHH phosphoesterase n=1 Tax=Fusarium tjaetaba TaxID=1567544 RepID=A0A8H5SAG3_9HYPO|nr:DHH phosphoesterase [Fusarium tjaetaba]KAF5649810.1 DHH phosphoesterase [Fusarium tjaetaba]